MKKIKIINPVSCAKFLASITGMLLTFTCFSQERAQADVNITSVTIISARSSRPTTVAEIPSARNQPGTKVTQLPENLKCSVTVHSYWDDDASDAKLIVVLPVEVSIVSMPSNATAFKAGGTSPWTGYLVFSLGDIAVQQSITVEFTFTKSPTGNNKVSAFTYSATSDPNPSNNYKDATY